MNSMGDSALNDALAEKEELAQQVKMLNMKLSALEQALSESKKEASQVIEKGYRTEKELMEIASALSALQDQSSVKVRPPFTPLPHSPARTGRVAARNAFANTDWSASMNVAGRKDCTPYCGAEEV